MGRTRYMSKTESTLFFFNSCLELVEEGAKNEIIFGVWACKTISGENYGGGASSGTEHRWKVMAVGRADTEAALRLQNEDGR